MANTLKGPGEARTYDGSSLRIGIVHARWNPVLIDALVAGTRAALRAAGVRPANIVVQSVPGSYELPVAAQRMYLASQQQAAAAAVGGVGGGMLGGLIGGAAAKAGGAAADLLGSATDLGKVGQEAEQRQQQKKAPEEGEEEEEASTGPLDAVVAIGALIKGETMHFEYICEAVTQGIMRVQLDTGCPVIFGVLALLKEEQGLDRAGMAGGKAGASHNHGEDWGAAAVELGVKRRAWAEGRFVD